MHLKEISTTKKDKIINKYNFIEQYELIVTHKFTKSLIFSPHILSERKNIKLRKITQNDIYSHSLTREHF